MFFNLNKRKTVSRLIASLLAMVTLGAHADDVTYNYLVMKENSGTLTPLSVTNLELTFGDGKLYATGADGNRTFTLASLASMYFSENAPATEPLLGDANDDGVITVADYVAVGHYIQGRTPTQWNAANADVNGDGVVNVADYVGIVHIILNQTAQ